MKGTTSKFIGVSWNTKQAKWVVNIVLNDQTKYLGQFNDEKEAAQCRDDYIKENNLPGFNLNNP